jgi:hypothetical protein
MQEVAIECCAALGILPAEAGGFAGSPIDSLPDKQPNETVFRDRCRRAE